MAARQSQVARFYKNNRGNFNLIDDNNYVYVWNQGERDTPDVRTYWKCQEYKICDVRACVLNNNIVRVPKHDHPSDMIKLEAELQSLEAVARAVENPTIKPRQILGDLANQPSSLAVKLARRPEASLVRTIQKLRAAAREEPNIPKNFDDLLSMEIPEKYSKTKDGEIFLRLKDTVSENSDQGIVM